jgi:hypothetical protein
MAEQPPKLNVVFFLFVLPIYRSTMVDIMRVSLIRIYVDRPLLAQGQDEERSKVVIMQTCVRVLWVPNECQVWLKV